MEKNLQYYDHIKDLEEKLGFKITNPILYFTACAHRSYQNEAKVVTANNERLEFLGDSVLSLIVSEFLFQNFPDFSEGELSFAKSKLVDATACLNYIKQMQIESFLLLGKGEMTNLGKGRDSVIADFFEALIGAMFLDLGLIRLKELLLEKFSSKWLEVAQKKEENEKVLLQEYVQKKFQEIPEYQIISETGPDHDKQFLVSVSVQGKQIGEGIGSSKKQAQQNAAKAALDSIKNQEE